MSRRMAPDGVLYRAVITIVWPARPADQWFSAQESTTTTHCVGPYTTRRPASHAITKAKNDRSYCTVTGHVERGEMQWTQV